MEIFEFNDVRAFLRASLERLPKAGHGERRKIAKAAGVSTAFFSQVLSGQRQLSPEHGIRIAEHLGFTEEETDFFLGLVQLDRAGVTSLRKQIERQLGKIRAHRKSVANRFKKVTEVSPEDQPRYYSDWPYIAVQQLTAIPGFGGEEQISSRLGLNRKNVREVAEFLLRTGLCVLEKGQLKIGLARIHLAPDSPWIKQHHANWRGRALESITRHDPRDLHYSSPMTLSKKDFEKVRAQLLAAIGEVGKVVDPSPSEELVCLNLDWFRV
jgi:uncharacterized protein (TIGR02147 family)